MPPQKSTTEIDGDLSVDEARSIASDAFVFGLPLVYIGVQVDVMTHVGNPDETRAPINQFVHFREFPDAANKQIVGLNVDTLYSLATLDLTAEPIVLSVPEMGDRWWLMQLVDAWNDVFAAPGARTVGGRGGQFALVGPGWTGRLPAGVAELRADTNLVMVGGRTYTAGEPDYAYVHAIQDRYRLTPLSQWGKDYAPPNNVPLKPGVDAQTPVPTQVFAMTPEAFFSRLDELLVTNPARGADAAMMARMARLGITPGARFTSQRFTPAIRDAIARGVADGQKIVRASEAKMGELVNGWQLARDLGRYGTKYAYRAAWTFFAVGANLVEDAIYPLALSDGEGRSLDGSQRYVIRFDKAQIPPVDAFWSLTMYDADSFLVDNPIDRYSRGDRDGLTFGADGSLTLYIQRDPPDTDKETNWLPAPAGRFKLALRLYRPRQEVIDGRWRPPALERIADAR